MRIISLWLLCAALICVPATHASSEDKPEPSALTAARKEYEAGVALAHRVHQAALEKLAKGYRDRLSAMVEERTKKGDLDGALAVRKEGERVGNNEEFPQGKWVATYNADTKRTYLIDGTSVIWSEEGTRGVASLGRGFIAVVFDDKHSERWIPCTDGRICIEHFKPKVQGAHEVGIMVKVP